MTIDSLNRDSLNKLYTADHDIISQGFFSPVKMKADYHNDLLLFQKISADTLVPIKVLSLRRNL